MLVMSFPEQSFKYSMPAKKMVPTGILIAFGAIGCTLMILGGGLEGKSLSDHVYAYAAAVICYWTTGICFLSLVRKNNMIEIHNDHLVIPSLWTGKKSVIKFRDIDGVDFYNGKATHVPPYMVINFQDGYQVGIMSVRMQPGEYSKLCESLEDKVPKIHFGKAA